MPLSATVDPAPGQVPAVQAASSGMEQLGEASKDRPGNSLPETIAAPLPELKAPPPGLPGDKLFLSFSEKPDTIVRIMDEAVSQQSVYLESNRKLLRLFTLLAPVGALFIVLDWLIGGSLVSLALVGYACWVAALAGWLIFRRSRAFKKPDPPAGMAAIGLSAGRTTCSTNLMVFIVVGIFVAGFFIFPWMIVSLVVSDGQLTLKSFWVALLIVFFFVLVILYITLWRQRSRGIDFGPKFPVARGIFETLKDDVSPKRTFTGWLDLTGAQQPGKLFREKTSQSGMPVAYYRDEWLRLKATLYDGSLLRLSAVERSKARLGRWKRGMSGKTKWKPGGLVQVREVLSLVVVPNPTTHQLSSEIPTIHPESSLQIGNYYIESLQAQDGRLVCDAVSYNPVDAWDLLQVMKYVHGYISPRLEASTAASD
jgi:hypothetical protein